MLRCRALCPPSSSFGHPSRLPAGGCPGRLRDFPEKIAPREQPLEIYQGKGCQALATEQATLSRQLADAEDQQRAAHERDIHVAETLGVLPIPGTSPNMKDDIATLKGQLVAIAAVGEQKSCRLRKVDLNDPDLRRPKEAAPPAEGRAAAQAVRAAESLKSAWRPAARIRSQSQERVDRCGSDTAGPAKVELSARRSICPMTRIVAVSSTEACCSLICRSVSRIC